MSQAPIPVDVDAPVLHHGDCLAFMRTMPAASVHLIFVDPPYFKVKAEAWDRQWDKPAGFLAWIGELADEWRRILAPNGSLYCCASPRMQARVECVIAERFEILNSIVWAKPPYSTKAEMFDKSTCRGYFPATERIIFAEQRGADSMAMGESGYEAQCEKLRGFVFEPLRAYLAGERDRAGIDNAAINAAWCQWKSVASTSQTQKWFSKSCWNMPTPEAYEWLRELFGGGDYLRREYDDLRREYDDLRREYDDLRRFYAVTADVPYTDVWDFATVQSYKGKHSCEKPIDLMRHIIKSSTRPNALVLDCFCGSGATGAACVELGRRFVGIDADAGWVEKASARLAGIRAGDDRPPILALAEGVAA
jgi:site-specific DNA-methyltransferase (adenine-specific)